MANLRPAVKTITEFSEGKHQDYVKNTGGRAQAAVKARHLRWHVKRNQFKEGCLWCEDPKRAARELSEIFGVKTKTPSKIDRVKQPEMPVVTTTVDSSLWLDVKEYIKSYPEANLRAQIISENEVIVWNH